jgi:hypothetical protein
MYTHINYVNLGSSANRDFLSKSLYSGSCVLVTSHPRDRKLQRAKGGCRQVVSLLPTCTTLPPVPFHLSMGRSPCCDENGLKKGPWTPEEDQKLMEYIQKHGHGSWRALPRLAGM